MGKVINKYKPASFVYMLVGLVMMIVPGLINSSFGYVIGAICLFIGSIQIYSYVENRALVFNLTIGIIMFLFGVYLFINPTFIASIIPFVAGIFVIINAASKVADLLAFRDIKSTYWVSNLIITILMLALGVFLMFNPLGSLELLIRIFGIVLFISGLSDIIIISNNIKKLK